MADNELAPLNDNTDSPSDALLPVAVAPHSNGEWDGVSLPAMVSKPAGPDLTICVHAFRRHWLLSLGIGLLCAAIIGPVVYVVIGDKYTSTSLLRVAMQENVVLFKDQAPTVDRDRFDIYKSTQEKLLISPFVLRAALDKPEVAKLPIIREGHDPVDWLTKNISVSFPGRAEVMAVSLSRDNSKEAQLLVKAVVDAYISEVVNAESSRKQQRLNDLEKLYAEREQEQRKKRETLKTMARESGGSEAETVSMRQKLRIEELERHRTHAANAQYSMGTIKADLAAQKAILKNVDTADVPAADLDAMVQNDPAAREIAAQIAEKQRMQNDNGGAIKPGVKSGFFNHSGDDVGRLQEQYDARVATIHAKARQKRRQAIETEIVRLDAMLKATAQQQGSVNRDITKVQSDVEKIGVTSVGMDMLKSDLDDLRRVQSLISAEMEKLRVEINSEPRIKMLEPADEPLSPSNKLQRMLMACFGMMVGLCGPVVLVVLWDIRVRRINTTSDVSRGLQLPVIGSVPLIPARVIRQLGSPSPRHRAWHLRLTESVDGIAARLLHKADVEQCRVIMVSSATGGEGKTTLATQLALSLARTGRQIVLVDFDLRRPSFDEVFGVPLTPGVSDTLRNDNGIAELVHPSASDNLAVVTAGRWNRQALASLSNGGAAALFRQLRESFEFVVVDTSPILPVADARFVSKFVDTVVLSVFRDVSEAPKIQAACDILAAFGVRSVEAVVTGPNRDLFSEHTGYESTVSV